MLHLESLLKQLVLLPATLSLIALPSMAAGTDTLLASSSSGQFSYDRISATSQKKHKVRLHKDRKSDDDSFTNRFSLPFLPAINQ